MPASAKASDLLSWYDAHAREMPWRVAPQDRKNGQIPDPYRIWLSEIMLQQTTVAAVKKYFLRFTSFGPRLAILQQRKTQPLWRNGPALDITRGRAIF